MLCYHCLLGCFFFFFLPDGSVRFLPLFCKTFHLACQDKTKQRLKEFMKTTVNRTLCSCLLSAFQPWRHGESSSKSLLSLAQTLFHHTVTSWIYTNLSQLWEVKRRKRKKKIFFLLPKVFLLLFYFNPASLEEIFSSLKFYAVITNYKRVCARRHSRTHTL